MPDAIALTAGAVRDGRVPAGSGPVPEAARGRWCVIRAPDLVSGVQEAWPFLSYADADGADVGGHDFLGRVRTPLRKGYATIAFVPSGAVLFRLATMYPLPPGSGTTVRFRPVRRAGASLAIIGSDWGAVPKLLRLGLSREWRRARTVLFGLAARLHRPDGYDVWTSCFDIFPPTPPPGAEDRASISALVLQHDPANAAPLQATLASIAAQGVPMAHAVLAGPDAAPWRDAVARLPGDYIAILQAGETLPPHAGWLAGTLLRRAGNPALALADEDRVGPGGERTAPAFRPTPSRTLMLSGTQTRGAWFVRRDVLLAHDGTPAPGWAESLRLDLWLRQFEAGHGKGHLIPLVLTHRSPDTETAPAPVLAEAVNAHLLRTGLALHAAPSFPLLLRSTGPAQGKVLIVIPSTLRTPLVRQCILSVLRETAEVDFELIVGVSQPGPLDPVQRDAAASIGRDPRAQVLHLPFQSFNFSKVCNTLAAARPSASVLLLNDDISVLEPGWLREMAAHLTDPKAGIVGAKLMYPDGTVQHGGVIMGLAGLCDHASRHLDRSDPGYEYRSVLAQEFSAVTAACMLVRRTVFEAVGGLDEAYPSAFNDVDFCLRVGEAGFGVVFAPAAELVHHEMQTYGSHYSGDRAPFEAEEVARMRRRWAGVVANDPFHSPNLDLVPGREWRPAFPPRRPRSMVE